MRFTLLLFALLLGSCENNTGSFKREIIKIKVVELGTEHSLRLTEDYFIYVGPDSIERKAFTRRKDLSVNQEIRLEIDSTKNGRVYPRHINSF